MAVEQQENTPNQVIGGKIEPSAPWPDPPERMSGPAQEDRESTPLGSGTDSTTLVDLANWHILLREKLPAASLMVCAIGIGIGLLVLSNGVSEPVEEYLRWIGLGYAALGWLGFSGLIISLFFRND